MSVFYATSTRSSPAAQADEVSSEPFSFPGADFALRSSDGKVFHVVKSNLAFFSPIFKDMFQLGSPTSTEGEVIPLSEPRTVLAVVLGLCHPTSAPQCDLSKLRGNVVLDCYEACPKYDMHQIGLILQSSVEYDHSKIRISYI
jgi:hypothetical protein